MTNNVHTLRLYDDLAWLWPMWGRPEAYAGYCAHVGRLLQAHARIPVRTLLDVGCGGGKNVFNLKRACEVTGLDLSPRMLEHARELNPECEFVQGDMRVFRLERTFDAVLMDDSISYMASVADLRSAFAAAWRHLRPGGIRLSDSYTVITLFKVPHVFGAHSAHLGSRRHSPLTTNLYSCRPGGIFTVAANFPLSGLSFIGFFVGSQSLKIPRLRPDFLPPPPIRIGHSSLSTSSSVDLPFLTHAAVTHCWCIARDSCRNESECILRCSKR